MSQKIEHDKPEQRPYLRGARTGRSRAECQQPTASELHVAQGPTLRCP